MTGPVNQVQNRGEQHRLGKIIMDLKEYLKRIGFEGEAQADLRTLKNMQTSHLLTVPYENLDALMNKPIILKNELLYDKIVRQSRGGWCHELNGLFHWALEQIGFETWFGNAKCRSRDGKQWCRDFDHMVCLVRLGDEIFYADRPFHPILIRDGEVSKQATGTFRLSFCKQTAEWSLCHRGKGASGEWATMLKFWTQPFLLRDFQDTCTTYEKGLDQRESLLGVTPVVVKSDPADSTATHMIIGNKYRLYCNVGLKNKTTCLKEDHVTLEQLHWKLKNIFGINLELEQMDSFYRHLPQAHIDRAMGR
eukprot:TCALIF_09453-PA protein Name:"Similar to Arylamine N-acetyltransferase, pineal gland isozyme NAT-3 (Gallus gallus)" AED:0.27 eAED:0.27 QI:0/0.6/0.5/1/0.8/0.66/6/235/306